MKRLLALILLCVISAACQDNRYHWSPDGRTLYYHTKHGQQSERACLIKEDVGWTVITRKPPEWKEKVFHLPEMNDSDARRETEKAVREATHER